MLKPSHVLVLAGLLTGCVSAPGDSSLSNRGVGKWKGEVVCETLMPDTRDIVMFKLSPGDLPYTQHGLLVFHDHDTQGNYQGFATWFVELKTTPISGNIALDIDHQIAMNGSGQYFDKKYGQDAFKRGQFIDDNTFKLNLCGRVSTFKRIPQDTPLDAPPLEQINYK